MTSRCVIPESLSPYLCHAQAMGNDVREPRCVPPRDAIDSLPTKLGPGEMATLNALTDLTAEWTIFVQPRVVMAQPDFVALHPDKGVWILEVKDWNPGYYRRAGQRGGRSVEMFNGELWVGIQSPRIKVAAYQEIFQERFFSASQGHSGIRNSVRALLVLPQFSAKEASELFGNYPVIGTEDLATLAERLEGEVELSLDPFRYRELLYWLDEPEFVGDQRLPLPLSRQAREVAENPRKVESRRVRGPAGSGKSLALASRAIVLASHGKSLLIVTYNITLSHYLRDLCSRSARERGVRNWKQSISFVHFHELLRELWIQRGRPVLDSDEWDVGVINHLGNEYSRPAHDLPTFDAILIDEGQDFEREWWQFIRANLLKPDGEMLLVADRTQNLYDRSNWTSEGISGGGFSGPWLELKGTYRMPVDLIPIAAEFGSRYLPDDDRDLPTIEGDHPAGSEAHKPTVRRWVNVDTHDTVRVAADEVEALFRSREGLSPSDIVLLADHDVGEQVMSELQERGNDVISVFTTAPGDFRQGRKRAFWGGSPGIKGCTIHSFKGWESRAVVCIPPGNSPRSLYIAMTRVKANPSRRALLTIVNPNPGFNPFKARFEREVTASEVPELLGQEALEI